MNLVIVGVALIAAIAVYAKAVRPMLRKLGLLAGFYAVADTFWARVYAQLRAGWDLLAAGLVIVLPELPDLLTQLQAVDLEAIAPSPEWKMAAKGAGIMIPLARALLLRRLAKRR